MSRKVLATKIASNEPDDPTRIVLVRIDHARKTSLNPNASPDREWVTWVFNTEDGSHYWGHYYGRLDEAIDDYNRRGVLTGLTADDLND